MITMRSLNNALTSIWQHQFPKRCKSDFVVSMRFDKRQLRCVIFKWNNKKEMFKLRIQNLL